MCRGKGYIGTSLFPLNIAVKVKLLLKNKSLKKFFFNPIH